MLARRVPSRSFALLFLTVSLGPLIACSGRSVDVFASTPAPDGGTEPAVDASVSTDSSTEAEAPLDCAASPLDDARVVQEACGVFVAPERAGGLDAAPGTRERPLVTIGTAAGRARSEGRRWVFACAASYDEVLAFDASLAGVSLFGGLACPGEPGRAAFSRRDDAHAALAPRAQVAAKAVLTISDLVLPTKIHAFDVVAPDAASGSSVAVWVADVRALEIRAATIRAGKGAAGAAGTEGVSGEPDDAGAFQWHDDGTGTQSVPMSCLTGGATWGGSGGTARADSASTGGYDGHPWGLGGAGGSVESCHLHQTGGSNGRSGAPGKPGKHATTLGTFDDLGWRATSGEAGTAGTPGGGGGGGAAGSYVRAFTVLGAGGAGGAGTCGGGGGAGGGGGGASVGIAVRRSTLSLVASTVRTSDGGAGGAGGSGRVAALGPDVGRPGTGRSGDACGGGWGGPGGTGGTGGGGAGGISVAVLTDGSPVQRDASSHLETGAAAAGGAGGVRETRAIAGSVEAMLAITK